MKDSQRELATLIGSSTTAISTYEKGTSIPSFELILSISQLFNVSIDDLIGQDLTNSIFNKEISLPYFLVIPIQKFLLSFSEYSKHVKGVSFNLRCTNNGHKIILTATSKDLIRINEVSDYFQEYVNLATGKVNIGEIEVLNSELLNQKEEALIEFSNEVDSLKRRIKFLNSLNGNLIDENLFLRELSEKLNTSIIKRIENNSAEINILKDSKSNESDLLYSNFLKISQYLLEEIISYLESTFLKHEIKQLNNFIELEEILTTIKSDETSKSSKIKLAIPLLNYVGITIETETEFDLIDKLKSLKNKAESIVIKTIK